MNGLQAVSNTSPDATKIANSAILLRMGSGYAGPRREPSVVSISRYDSLPISVSFPDGIPASVPVDATIECMSAAVVAIVCALGILVPVLLGFLPSQRKRHALRR